MTPNDTETPSGSDSSEPGRARLPDLGRRGEGWVVLQVVVFVIAAATGWLGTPWPVTARPGLAIAAALVFVAGIGLLLAGGAGLGKQLTPFPRPVESGVLRRDGVYALVRHPIYGGVLLVLLAWALASSPWALVPLALGSVFFEAKRRREEVWLVEQYCDYADYRRRVPRRFIPFLW
jgi:protein-S-isoprenylcysteine O-methyltransferase Ste14